MQRWETHVDIRSLWKATELEIAKPIVGTEYESLKLYIIETYVRVVPEKVHELSKSIVAERMSTELQRLQVDNCLVKVCFILEECAFELMWNDLLGIIDDVWQRHSEFWIVSSRSDWLIDIDHENLITIVRRR